ncbi:hypothetical protein HZQ92_18015 [Elizabethkingia anophelis]|nr:hypothetical protein [Elizabethkingia anophelis]MCT3932390.1 hypothetical protein [Elizabethkingia anophelis]MCT4113758.1 hypothetical protein [Elizabethkingia anophelis]
MAYHWLFIADQIYMIELILNASCNNQNLKFAPRNSPSKAGVLKQNNLNMENIIPVINTELLQQKANEYAMKGAEDALKEFYTSYNSPYKKAIEENLNNKGLDHSFDIPDIIGVLNDRLSHEVDQIANAAIAKSFVPLVKKFLTREEPEIKFSYILEKFIERTDYEYKSKNGDIDRYDYSAERINEKYDSFFDYKISNGKIGYELRFYQREQDKIEIMSLPYLIDEDGKSRYRHEVQEKMKVSLDDGASLELPFVKGILEDDFVSFIARLVIGNNNIIFDVEDFEDDMFPNNHCYCD